jgi:hypothetical protein
MNDQHCQPAFSVHWVQIQKYLKHFSVKSVYTWVVILLRKRHSDYIKIISYSIHKVQGSEVFMLADEKWKMESSTGHIFLYYKTVGGLYRGTILCDYTYRFRVVTGQADGTEVTLKHTCIVYCMYLTCTVCLRRVLIHDGVFCNGCVTKRRLNSSANVSYKDHFSATSQW